VNNNEKNNVPTCAVLLIAAPASGQGKTLITAALAAYFGQMGVRTQVFKAGPDFLDPMILQHVTQAPVYNIDLWLLGKSQCSQLLHEAAKQSDLILIECHMGLYDGTPCCADLARAFSLPILLVIDAKGMAQSFGAIVKGLATYHENIQINGVIANNVGSAYHGQILKDSLEDCIKFCGYMPRSEQMKIPSRHLGLLQATEIEDLDQRIKIATNYVKQQLHVDLPQPIAFPENEDLEPLHTQRPLQGIRIGVAKDKAFSFIYPRNIDLLIELGAKIYYFSPMHDQCLPKVHGLWLPGGYPECYGKILSENKTMGNAIREHFTDNLPILAECGGMLYLCDTLTDSTQMTHKMLGILPAHVIMQTNCVSVGLQTAELPEGPIKGHTFHHSRVKTSLAPINHAQKQHSLAPGEAIYRDKRLTATYLHLYFPSNPSALISLFTL